MIFRQAEISDMEKVYILSNDPEVRKYSFNTLSINYNEHRDWFKKQLADKNLLFFVALENDDLVGQVRLSNNEGVAVISVSVSPSYAGRGYGVEIMRETISYCQNKGRISMIKAFIKAENTGSKKYFEKCGYELFERTIHNNSETDVYTFNL